MGWPIQFAKEPKEAYGFLSPQFMTNAFGNGAVAIVGGISLGVIAHVALNALGFPNIANIIALAIPVVLGAFGVATIAVGLGTGALLLYIILSLISR